MRLFPDHKTIVRERMGEFFYPRVPDSISEDRLQNMMLRVETERACKPISTGLRPYTR